MSISPTYVAPTTPGTVSWQLQQTQGPAPTTAVTGSGAIAGTQSTPDTGTVPGLNAIMASVLAVTPKMTGEQLDVLVLSLTSKMKDSIDASEKDKIKTDTDAKKIAIHNKSKKLEEAQKKIEEAIDKMSHASIWDKIKLAFSFLGAILTMISAIVLMATMPGIGQVAGGMLFGAGLVMLGMAIDQTVEVGMTEAGKGQFGMFGLAIRAFAKLEGKSDAEADEIATKGQMGTRIALMGLAMALSAPAMAIALGSVVAGAAEAAVEVAQAAMEAVSMAAQIAQMAMQASTVGTQVAEAVEALAQGALQIMRTAMTASETASAGMEASASAGQLTETAEAAQSTTALLQKIQRFMEASNDIVTMASQAGEATSTVGSAVTHYQATEYQADAKKLQSQAKVFEAMQNMLDDMIDQALARLKGNGDRFNTMLDSLVEAVKDKGDTMFHAHFRA